MKRVILGSLLSCIVVGQVFGASTSSSSGPSTSASLVYSPMYGKEGFSDRRILLRPGMSGNDVESVISRLNPLPNAYTTKDVCVRGAFGIMSGMMFGASYFGGLGKKLDPVEQDLARVCSTMMGLYALIENYAVSCGDEARTFDAANDEARKEYVRNRLSDARLKRTKSSRRAYRKVGDQVKMVNILKDSPRESDTVISQEDVETVVHAMNSERQMTSLGSRSVLCWATGITAAAYAAAYGAYSAYKYFTNKA